MAGFGFRTLPSIQTLSYRVLLLQVLGLLSEFYTLPRFAPWTKAQKAYFNYIRNPSASKCLTEVQVETLNPKPSGLR